jgi:hypothetical protein
LNFLDDLRGRVNYRLESVGPQVLTSPTSTAVKHGTKRCLHFLGVELCLSEATQYHGQSLAVWSELRHQMYFFTRVKLGAGGVLIEVIPSAIMGQGDSGMQFGVTSNAIAAPAGTASSQSRDTSDSQPEAADSHDAILYVDMKANDSEFTGSLVQFLARNPLQVPTSAHPALGECKVELYTMAVSQTKLVTDRRENFSTVVSIIHGILNTKFDFEWLRFCREVSGLAKQACMIPASVDKIFKNFEDVDSFAKVHPCYTIALIAEIANNQCFFNWDADSAGQVNLKHACELLSNELALDNLNMINAAYFAQSPEQWMSNWVSLLLQLDRAESAIHILQSILNKHRTASIQRKLAAPTPEGSSDPSPSLVKPELSSLPSSSSIGGSEDKMGADQGMGKAKPLLQPLVPQLQGSEDDTITMQKLLAFAPTCDSAGSLPEYEAGLALKTLGMLGNSEHCATLNIPPASCGVAMIQSMAYKLQSLVHDRAFLNQPSQDRLNELRVDAMSKVPTVTTDKPLSHTWMLHYTGEVSFVKKDPCLFLTTIFGVDFYINRTNHHLATSTCPAPAWMVKVVDDALQATTENVTEVTPYYLYVSHPQTQPWGFELSSRKPPDISEDKVVELLLTMHSLKSKLAFCFKPDVALTRVLASGEELKKKRGEKETAIASYLGAAGYVHFTAAANNATESTSGSDPKPDPKNKKHKGAARVPTHLLK